MYIQSPGAPIKKVDSVSASLGWGPSLCVCNKLPGQPHWRAESWTLGDRRNLKSSVKPVVHSPKWLLESPRERLRTQRPGSTPRVLEGALTSELSGGSLPHSDVQLDLRTTNTVQLLTTSGKTEAQRLPEFHEEDSVNTEGIFLGEKKIPMHFATLGESSPLKLQK